MSLSNAVGVIGGVNECVNLFQWVWSAISHIRSKWNRTQEQKLEEDRVQQQLQRDVQSLKDTLPSMYNLIDQAEWRSHEPNVQVLLPNLKDAVYDAEDLLDEFRWYKQKMVVEGNSTQLAPFIDFFRSVTQGDFSKVSDVLKRLNDISSRLQVFGLHQTMPQFDKKVRPETSSYPTERKMFGRDEEMQKVIRLLGVCAKKRKRSSRTSGAIVASASNQVITTPDNNDEATIASVPVLAIVGIGGVGKTTLAQNISNHPRVKSRFDLIIWICVSDDFDEKRLTKEALEQTKTKAETGSLNSLQNTLAKKVNKKRLLLILDDMWDDALRENGMCWKRFSAPFTNVLRGSMMLVTTRSKNVATGVCAIHRIELKGLQGDIFWDFFKQCAFGSSNNDAELVRIGRGILPKLGGSPLAAKTIGRLLCMNPNITHWNNILESELWELPQQDNEILPALRLSYIYLPLRLKKCFSFCAVYPKDHKFKKDDLAEIWVAEGFVEAQGQIPIQDIACQYFDDLATLSFFQMSRGDTYVIHDLMHDMAQLVSKEECFVIKNQSDFQNVPENVRHLSILSSRDIGKPDLLSLCKHRKLRTLLCNKPLMKISYRSVMDSWCSELRCMRVLICASTSELPESIRNMKHLRYLEIFRFKKSVKRLPSGFCCLYNLQKIYLRKCELKNLPDDFGNLIDLQRFDSLTFRYQAGRQWTVDAGKWQDKIGFLKNINQFQGTLHFFNLDLLRKDQAAEAKLDKKKSMNGLNLVWSDMRSPEHNVVQEVLEALEALHPPIGLKYLELFRYPCESLPSWFHPYKLQKLTTLGFSKCNGLESISLINLNDTPVVPVLDNNDNNGIFSFLTNFEISDCANLSSLEQLLQPANVPAIKKISIQQCQRLVSIRWDRFRSFRSLISLIISDCPRLNWESGMVLPSSLEYLTLANCGDFSVCGTSCLENLTSLQTLKISFLCNGITSIPASIWRSNLVSLRSLCIHDCPNLKSIGGVRAIQHIKEVRIEKCPKLKAIKQPYREGWADELPVHESNVC